MTAVPEARARVFLTLRQNEPGQFTLEGDSGYSAGIRPERPSVMSHFGSGPIAVGLAGAFRQPEREAAGRAPESDPAFRRPVTVELASGQPQGATPTGAANVGAGPRARPGETPPRVTPADVLEALHRATGLDLVADHYTRLYPPDEVTVRAMPLRAALDRLTDRMRLRWERDREGGWLRFRSATYYNDRLKEVPNRLLSRWEAARRKQAMLTLDDLVEITALSDAQLDAAEMAEGAKEIYGLVEWDLARARSRRRHLRYLGEFTSDQRREAMSPQGLLFTRMPLAQQQQFLTFALGPNAAPLGSLEELSGATLRVDYTQPGEFEWRQPVPGWMRSVVPVAKGVRAPRPRVQARTPAEALETARQVYAPLRELWMQPARRLNPQLDEARFAPQPAQIVPTELNLTILYMPGSSHARYIQVVHGEGVNTLATWETSVVPSD
jgi:hypothetical protein